MAQEYTTALSLGSTQTGLAATLRAQLYDTAGAAVGALLSGGFTEWGQGAYSWHYAAYPDGFEGTVVFTKSGFPAVPVFVLSLNNADFGITSGADNAAIAAAVWAYASRTLTQAVASAMAAVLGTGLALLRGDTWIENLTGLGNITGRTKLWFTVKTSENDQDSEALIQILEVGGLQRLNGAAATAGQGSIVVTDATTGALTINLAAAATAQLAIASRLYYDVQWLGPNGVLTAAAGRFTVLADVTRSTV